MKLSDWWNEEEIVRYMWTCQLGRDPDEKFSEGQTRMHWIQLFDNFLQNKLNYDLTEDQYDLLISGDVTIIGRDKYYRPVIYVNLQSLNDDNQSDYELLIGKMISIARTYMCIPTKVENTWLIINSDNRNTITILKSVYDILNSIRLINRICYSIINLNVGPELHVVWKAVMAMGMIHESNLIRTQVLRSADEDHFEVLKELIDLEYLPKEIGGTRPGQYPLTWPPNFPKLENYKFLIDKS